LLALANGCKTKKLKFGHRGANHPARSNVTGRTYITSQNHGYAVLRDSINEKIAEEMFVNVNDDTNEGILYHKINAFSVQFHPEGCGGPRDTEFLFDDFIAKMEEQKHAKM
jgi:carbamoyl-phosphate synthase small subunit